jgi:hypothetical protein
MTAPRPTSRPLPLRWVVLAIVIFILGYTFLRLHYAKRGRAFEPYHDLGEQASVVRLLALGYRRIPAAIERPAEPLPADRLAAAPAPIADALGGLPAELDGALAARPALPDAVEGVTAPRAAAAAGQYTLQFTCAQRDFSTQIRSVFLYRKAGRLFLLPDFEKMPGQLLARSRESTVLVSFPVQSLPPGRYTALLCGGRASKSWEFLVK